VIRGWPGLLRRSMGRPLWSHIALAAGLAAFSTVDTLLDRSIADRAVALAGVEVAAAALLALRRVRPLVALSGALGLLGAAELVLGHYQSWASVLIALVAVYSAAAYATNLPYVLAVAAAFAVTLAIGEPAGRAAADALWTIIALSLPLTVGLTVRRVRAREAEAQQRAAEVEQQRVHQMARAAADERRRIARELHDEVGQTLTGVMLQVEGLAGVVPDAAQDQLDELRETARHGTEEVRHIARRLRPEALDELGLQSAMAALATAIGEQARIPIERRLQPDPPLSKAEELVVYRVAQEALTNVVRPAGATRASLELRCRNGWTVLIVRDNGCGLSPRSLASSNGIRDVRERAMLIGADFSIHSPDEGDTEVRVSIPPTLEPT
jgi:signal transduction histidine kinase